MWVDRFLNDLKKAHKDTENLHYLVHGLGDKLKLIALRKNFKKLNKAPLLDAYSQSNNRVLIFDNEGTLSNFMKQTEINKKVGPSSRILRALELLCANDKNTVYVVTGRPREVVDNWFKSVDNLGLAAEYGAIMKAPASSHWESHFSISGNWKQSAKEIMAGYCERTEGSFIVEKESSIVFHYREADVEFGSYQAKELLSHLEFLLQPFMDEIEISEGIGYVEVKPIGINKGTALFRVFESVFENKGPVDFVLAIGDDNSDEDMFKMVRMLKKQRSRTLLHPRIPAFTCTLGIKPSSANYYLLDAMKVVSLLERINGETGNTKKNFSYDDLRNKKLGMHLKFENFKKNGQIDDNSED
jgi:trehalose 6-phosphate synthase/phosphatase